MKPTSFLFLVCMVLNPMARSQSLTFQKLFCIADHVVSSKGVQTKDGGYIVAGNDQDDFYITKLDSNGHLSWAKAYSAASIELVEDICEIKGGGFVIVGTTIPALNTNFTSKIYLAKINEIGQLIWSKKFGGDYGAYAREVKQTLDSGFLIGGRSDSADSYGDGYLLKTDIDGNEMWSRTYGIPLTHDDVSSFVQLDDGGYIVAGTMDYNYVDTQDAAFLMRINDHGDPLWVKSYTILTTSYGASVIPTPDGGFILGGSTSYPTSADSIYLLKTDSLGIPLWGKIYDGNTLLTDGCIISTSDNGFVIATTINAPGASLDACLIKTDDTGSIQWSKTYGSSKWETSSSVVENKNGGYFLTGSTDGLWGSLTRFFLIKTDPAGNSGCHEMSYSATSRNKLPVVNNPIFTVGKEGTQDSFVLTVTNAGILKTLCSSLSVPPNESPADYVTAYPNPSDGSVNFSLPGTHCTIGIFNSQGSRICLRNVESRQASINLASEARGIYFYSIKSEGIVIARGKFILR